MPSSIASVTRYAVIFEISGSLAGVEAAEALTDQMPLVEFQYYTLVDSYCSAFPSAPRDLQLYLQQFSANLIKENISLTMQIQDKNNVLYRGERVMMDTGHIGQM